MTSASPLRAVGVRAPYASVPLHVREWVEAELGSQVVQAATQPGGMSPGCAARLELANGSRAFVKAVGSTLNPNTPDLFRAETAVLSVLEPVAWRATLRAAYDDGDWVAMILDDIDGRHPNWAAPADVDRVLAAVEQQTHELTPLPRGLEIIAAAEQALRWAATLQNAAPQELAALPDWLDPEDQGLRQLLAGLPTWLSGDTLCHWDVRNDNLLIRPDGSVVIVDWGMVRRGPMWADTAVLALEWAETPRFDEIMAASPFMAGVDDQVLTAFLLGIGIQLTLTSTRPPPQGLPTMPAFRRVEGARFLQGARRRLEA